jgi:hemerythrin-like domain-containing protein
MSQLLERLHQDHKHLALLLDLLERLLDMFHAGEEPDYELMCEMLEYIENYADQVHHPSEDLIFKRLQTHADQHHAVLGVLMRQHEVLSEITRTFRQSLEGIVHEEVLRRDEVEAQGRELVETLRIHLNLEETEAFPLAREALTAEDWEAIEAAASKVADPLFSARDPARFRTLYQHLMSQTQS